MDYYAKWLTLQCTKIWIIIDKVLASIEDWFENSWRFTNKIEVIKLKKNFSGLKFLHYRYLLIQLSTCFYLMNQLVCLFFILSEMFVQTTCILGLYWN